jgi:hypothetical protein
MGVKNCDSASRSKARRKRQSLPASHRPAKKHLPATIPCASLHFGTMWNARKPTNQPMTNRLSVLPQVNRRLRCSTASIRRNLSQHAGQGKWTKNGCIILSMKKQDIIVFGAFTLLLVAYATEPRQECYRMKVPHTHNELPIPEQLAESAEVGNSTLTPQTFAEIGSLVDFMQPAPFVK